MSMMKSQKDNTLTDLPLTTTIGQLKQKLNTDANAHVGRAGKFENWDNRHTLADYRVKDNETLDCVVQCSKEEGQTSFDDYNQWAAENHA